jgi:hypothetical protein
MEDLFRSSWKGGTQPTSFPHLCPYRQSGAEDKQACIELGGKILRRNQDGCCGTQRGNVKFEPCNSAARRCVKCLELGRFALKANIVTNVLEGTCDEHAKSAEQEEPRSFRLASIPGARTAVFKSRTPVKAEPVSPPIPPSSTPSSGTDAVLDKGIDEPVTIQAVEPSNLPAEQVPALAPEIVEPSKPDHAPEEKKVAASDAIVLPTVDDAFIDKGAESARKLKGRNLRLFSLCGEGLDNIQIAARENTTPGTIGVTMVAVYKAIGVHELSHGLKRSTAREIYRRYIEKQRV